MRQPTYRNPMALEPGLQATVTLRVSEADTAIALRSGDVAVLATPRLLALCEEATCRALDGHLDPGRTTVGIRVQLDHVQATPVGGEVRAEATLEKVEGNQLTFTVAAHDGRGLIGAGRVTRVSVDRQRFIDKLA